MSTIGQWWMWAGFFGIVIVMLVVDILLCGGGKAHRVSTKEALSWTGVWVSLALLFNAFIWLYVNHSQGAAAAHDKALEFFTGYLIEKSLSIDNVFIFLMIFSSFAVPAELQRRVLLYGIVGAIVMRLILIFMGVWLISTFHWILYVFGVFLLFMGIKMCFSSEETPDLQKNRALIWMQKHIRLTHDFHRERFFVRKNKLLYATPLFLVLLLIELSDLVFAFDSIPAIFSVTEDPFIVFTSNIFAILGLRALYFLFANLSTRFHYLKYALAFILTFIGCKLLIMHWYKIPISVALAVVVLALVLSILFSVYRGPKTALDQPKA